MLHKKKIASNAEEIICGDIDNNANLANVNHLDHTIRVEIVPASLFNRKELKFSSKKMSVLFSVTSFFFLSPTPKFFFVQSLSLGLRIESVF